MTYGEAIEMRLIPGKTEADYLLEAIHVNEVRLGRPCSPEERAKILLLLREFNSDMVREHDGNKPR